MAPNAGGLRRASKAALAYEFKQVYRLRSGLSRWEALGLPVNKN
jgi:hypothetical protein